MALTGKQQKSELNIEELTGKRASRTLIPFDPPNKKSFVVDEVMGLMRHGPLGENCKVWVLVKWDGDKGYNWVEHRRLDCDDLIADFVAKKYSEYLAGKENNDTESTGDENCDAACEFGPVYGFERGYPPDRVMGFTENGPNNTPMLLVKWLTPDGRPLMDVVPREEANTRIPQTVIKFYEEHIHWNCMVFSDSSEDES